MRRNYPAFNTVGRYWQNLPSIQTRTRRICIKAANRLSLNQYLFVLLSLASSGLPLWPTATLANTEDEIQVYNDAINAPGIFGLEIHSNYVVDGTQV